MLNRCVRHKRSMMEAPQCSVHDTQLRRAWWRTNASSVLNRSGTSAA